MNRYGDKDREIAELRGRLSRLSEASLRINESLEFGSVLQGVLDSARSLTNARFGVMILLEEVGQVQGYLSSGMTAEEADRLWGLPEGMEIFGYLGSIGAPLRVRDLLGHIRAMGLPELHPPVEIGPVVSFLASPVFHRGERVANVYLAEKEDGEEFTREDEETLVMFASQAALVIANARRHRDEQKARTDLETVIDTSPVGVVVFDARTGAPVSFNREARRIVDRLRDRDQSPEQLLEVITVMRADGREIRLDHLPMAQALRSGEIVRAEEIVIRAPDGRAATALLNATPIRSAHGEIESVVITVQDMAPLEEMERRRAEFLGMVSHELRTPLAAVKGSVTTLLEAGPDLDPAETTQFHRIIRDQADNMRELIGDLLDVARIETGTLPVVPEPSDAALLVDEARRRFQSESGREDVIIDLAPSLPPVMADRRRIVQVLGNLLSNASAYSPEGTPIRVSVVREGVYVAVSVADEGTGISAERLPGLFRKFSGGGGAEQERGYSGSGLGLAICKGIVETHGGRIWAESDGPGLGSRFTFTIPAADTEAIGGLQSLTLDSRRAARAPVRVLAVDDDPQALRYVRDALNKEGFVPIVTADPEDVLRLVQEERPNLVLLDLLLPGSDGIELMQEILKTVDVPVIFLSVYGQDEFVAKAFDMGATDYMVKPFSPTELAARIRAALRRRTGPFGAEGSERYVSGSLSVQYSKRQVTLDGQPIRLTAKEYAVLHELSVNAGRVLTLEVLLKRAWGPTKTGAPWLVREVVKKLRQKLGDNASNPIYIFTEARVGYRMAEADTLERWEAEG